MWERLRARPLSQRQFTDPEVPSIGKSGHSGASKTLDRHGGGNSGSGNRGGKGTTDPSSIISPAWTTLPSIVTMPFSTVTTTLLIGPDTTKYESDTTPSPKSQHSPATKPEQITSAIFGPPASTEISTHYRPTAAREHQHRPTATARPFHSTHNDDSDSGLSTGELVGAIVGSVLFIALLALGLFFLFRRRRRQQRSMGGSSRMGMKMTGSSTNFLAPNYAGEASTSSPGLPQPSISPSGYRVVSPPVRPLAPPSHVSLAQSHGEGHNPFYNTGLNPDDITIDDRETPSIINSPDPTYSTEPPPLYQESPANALAPRQLQQFEHPSSINIDTSVRSGSPFGDPITDDAVSDISSVEETRMPSDQMSAVSDLSYQGDLRPGQAT